MCVFVVVCVGVGGEAQVGWGVPHSNRCSDLVV